jgi:dTDP-glucose 4,6-dehydratase
VRWLLAHTDVRVVTLDALTYAGNLESLADVAVAHGPAGSGRHFFVHGDVRDATLVGRLLAGTAHEPETGRAMPPLEAVLHLAAESHVDRSIVGPAAFVETNVLGTQVLLDAVRVELEARPRDFRYVQVSTDEVYGSLGPDDPAFTEETPLAPNSPYSASKAAADCLVRAYGETYRLPVLTTRCSNNYGPYQFPEKLIPLMLTRAMADHDLPVYGDGLNVRDWLHVTDHCAALWAVLTRGTLDDRVYNIGGDAEHTNLDVVHRLLSLLGKPPALIRHVVDRKGHDRRYAMNSARLRARTGWKPAYTFEAGLAETVRWYETHRAWCERVRAEGHRVATALYRP